ncbi:MAG: DctP family TRAP transporter solute-binding subunit [Deltaproteobacteria bacterium]|nr:DctP family TRAP transporter solute-binding subunit [Deltaproteobacteria bacterium]
MKKALFILTLFVMTAVLASGASAKTVIKLANAGPDNPDNRSVKAVAIFKHNVEKRTKGAVEVQPYHARKLGDEREMMEGVRLGTIQMIFVSSGPIPGFFPPVMVFDIPFMFSSAPAAWEFFESDFGQEFNRAFLEKTGVRCLSITENGYRHFTNNVRPIKTPADMKGLKIRTMQNPAHMAMVKALGADPTPIPFGELYMALQQGVVDGMECPTVLIHDMKFYEVQNYMVLDGHLYNPLFTMTNEKWFNSKLTPEQRKIVTEEAQLLAHTHDGFSQQANIECEGKLKAKGMTIYSPTAEQLAMFRQAAQPAGLEFIEQKIGKEWVSKALAAAKKAEAKVGDKAEAIVKDHIKMANDLYNKIKK